MEWIQLLYTILSVIKKRAAVASGRQRHNRANARRLRPAASIPRPRNSCAPQSRVNRLRFACLFCPFVFYAHPRDRRASNENVADRPTGRPSPTAAQVPPCREMQLRRLLRHLECGAPNRAAPRGAQRSDPTAAMRQQHRNGTRLRGGA